jgi:hypothetical protein
MGADTATLSRNQDNQSDQLRNTPNISTSLPDPTRYTPEGAGILLAQRAAERRAQAAEDRIQDADQITFALEDTSNRMADSLGLMEEMQGANIDKNLKLHLQYNLMAIDKEGDKITLYRSEVREVELNRPDENGNTHAYAVNYTGQPIRTTEEMLSKLAGAVGSNEVIGRELGELSSQREFKFEDQNGLSKEERNQLVDTLATKVQINSYEIKDNRRGGYTLTVGLEHEPGLDHLPLSEDGSRILEIELNPEDFKGDLTDVVNLKISKALLKGDRSEQDQDSSPSVSSSPAAPSEVSTQPLTQPQPPSASLSSLSTVPPIQPNGPQTVSQLFTYNYIPSPTQASFGNLEVFDSQSQRTVISNVIPFQASDNKTHYRINGPQNQPSDWALYFDESTKNAIFYNTKTDERNVVDTFKIGAEGALIVELKGEHYRSYVFDPKDNGTGYPRLVGSMAILQDMSSNANVPSTTDSNGPRLW